MPSSILQRGSVYFLAWTTTPWTLPSNTALTIGPKIKYTIVSSFNQYTNKPINVILAKDLVSKVFSGSFIEVENEDELRLYTKLKTKIPLDLTLVRIFM